MTELHLLRFPHAGLRCAVAASLVASSCAGPTTPAPATQGSAAGGDELARLLPLTDGTVFSYATRTDSSSETGLLVIEVRRLSGSLVQLKSGARTQLLQLVPDGVRHAAGGFLLKRPLVPGTQFKGEFGTVRVTRVALTVDVPAGHFTRCLETVEELTQGEVSQSSTKVFCPDVGIVSLHTEAQSGADVLSDWAELKATGKRIEF